jgi:hypothetical protein
MVLEEEADYFGEKSVILAMMFESGAQKLGNFITGGGEVFTMLIGPGEEE